MTPDERGAFLGHLDENLTGPPVGVHADGDVAFVTADAELVGDRVAFDGKLFALGAGEEFTLNRFGFGGGDFGFLFVLLVPGGVERLGALGVVAIDGDSFEAKLPGLNVGVHDVFDRGIFRHVDGLADGAGEEGLGRRHHLDVTAPGDGTSAGGGQGAIENGNVFGLDEGRAVDFAVGINVADDFAGLLWRVAELHHRGRNGVVDDFDDAAADELLVFDEGEVRLDAGGVAIHHEADGAGGSENGDLGILEAVLFA